MYNNFYSILQQLCNTRHVCFPGTNSDYYVGETPLNRRKRMAIFPWTYSHSMIFFRGVVFEWGINDSYYMSRSPSSCQITWRSASESSSKCTLNDAKTWTRDYGRKNTYSWKTNNCHMFVNRLAKYLNDDCGRWLNQMQTFWRRTKLLCHTAIIYSNQQIWLK